MKTKLIRLCKGLYSMSKTIIGLGGTFFVVILCLWSVAFLTGNSMDKAQLDLKPLVASPEMAWIWVGTFSVFVIGTIVWLISEVKKGISKAKNPSLNVEEKSRSLFWWILKH